MRIAEPRNQPLGAVGCPSDPNEKCGDGLADIYPTTAVRFGYMKHVGEFRYKPGLRFDCGYKVVIQTDRGIEIGEQVSLTCSGCSKSIVREQMRAYAEISGDGYLHLNCGKILRQATHDDLHEELRINEQAREKLAKCREFVRKLKLPMKLVECEHLFGGERIIFYFMSENRVDFRELVRELAQEDHTRIEMRQIGARDEARLIADYETCGQECCCKTFLKTLKPISMKMAKLQKATLDPSKVSGRCGRLKCCLRYEHEAYEELNERLPRIGQQVRTHHGEGIVVDRQILTQLIQIETEDLRRIAVVVEDILADEVPEELEPAIAEPAATEESPEDRSAAVEEQMLPTAAGQEPSVEGREEKPKKRRRRRRRRPRRKKGKTNPDSSGPVTG